MEASTLQTLWSVKGGVGVTVLAASLASLGRRDGRVVLVDLCGDAPAVLGLPEPEGPGVLEWLVAERSGPESLDRLLVPVARDWDLLPCGSDHSGRWRPERAVELAATLAGWSARVVVDGGRRGGVQDRAGHDHLIDTLAAAGRSVLVTRACYLSLRRAVRAGVVPDGVVFVAEDGRSLSARDVADVVGARVLARVPHDMALARSVDAGLLTRRPHRPTERALSGLW